MDDLTAERYGPCRRVGRERHTRPRRRDDPPDTPELVAKRRRDLAAALEGIPQDFRRGSR